tara:strand:+ start:615 stop:1661 length:1047 start_codon:yes stop_codon:yes gene_type:complete
MAYKFQIGSAHMRGTTNVGGDVEVTGDITGSTYTIAANMDVRGTPGSSDATAVTMDATTAGTFAAAGGLEMSGNTQPIFKGYVTANTGRLDFLSSSVDKVVATIGRVNSHGAVILKDWNGGTPAAAVDLDDAGVTTTKDYLAGGNGVFGGNLTVAGNLFTYGDGADNITLAELETTDLAVQLNLAAGNGSGLKFGQGGAAAQVIMLNNAWGVAESDDSTLMPISASAWRGDGAQLTGVAASGLVYTRDSFSNPGSDQNIDSTKAFHTISLNASRNFNLPIVNGAASQVADGSRLIIKRTDSNAAYNATIRRNQDNADSAVRIDGEESIILGPQASVTLILHGNNWHIF